MESTGRKNPVSTRRRHRRRYYGLSDEDQRRVYTQQRAAIVAVFDALEEYFCADLDARLEGLDKAIREADEPETVDAEFSEEAPTE